MNRAFKRMVDGWWLMVRGSRRPGAAAAAASRGKRGHAGFTLIEILVATSILLIIVLLMSMIFQQSSGAYQSGTNRVNEQKVLRNILGMISRDMTLAVDSRNYPGYDNDFGPISVAFVALTGTPGNDEDDIRRTPQWIEFSYSEGKVTRTCTDLEWDEAGMVWKPLNPLHDTPPAKTESILNPEQDLAEFCFEILWPDDDGTKMLPLRVDVFASLSHEGKYSFARGHSAGRDREFGTDDDIIAGGPQW